ncbi:MAG: acyl-ACP desaturase [Deltaproteobacteria bacterium]|nr:acyl-ACP desaturase [Deltaproteobacteria bacterium]
MTQGPVTRIEEQLYRIYMEFFETAERERRWSLFNDIPWDKVNPSCSDDLALCAETFASVEMYLPDYVASGINVVRPWFGRAWWQANWGYEESKHSLALGEWLTRSGKRTKDQWFDHYNVIAEKQWEAPFKTARQMTLYGVVQEQATFVIYVKHRDFAKREGDECLYTIYDFIARDEVAHTRFYQQVVKVLLAEDREGTLADLAKVFAEFRMPGVDLVPDYDERILQMRGQGGVDRDLFIRKVYLPVLKYLDISRHEMLAAQRRALQERQDARENAAE